MKLKIVALFILGVCIGALISFFTFKEKDSTIENVKFEYTSTGLLKMDPGIWHSLNLQNDLKKIKYYQDDIVNSIILKKYSKRLDLNYSTSFKIIHCDSDYYEIINVPVLRDYDSPTLTYYLITPKKIFKMSSKIVKNDSINYEAHPAPRSRQH